MKTFFMSRIPGERMIPGNESHPLDLPEGLIGRLVELRRHLHMNPEIGTQEFETSALIRRTLEAEGLHVHGPIAGTGLYADITGSRPGATVAYRADIDALPAADAKQVAYASTREGAAHLCGHDMHATVAVGIALLLHRMREEIAGTVRVFFQPNEEGTPGGATDMIEDGVLEGVSAVYAIHVDPSLRTGRFGLIVGPATASVDQFRIHVRGAGGHSARPHETVDAIWVASQVAQALYQITGRLNDARNPAVLTICRFHAGDAYNVIPADAEFGGTLRCTNPEDREVLCAQIERTAEHVGSVYGADVEVEIARGAPPVTNDPGLVAHVGSVVREVFGDAAVHIIQRPSMGGEDFAHYLAHVAGAMVRVGTSSGPDTSFSLHDAHFDIDEEAIAPAVLLMARVLTSHPASHHAAALPQKPLDR